MQSILHRISYVIVLIFFATSAFAQTAPTPAAGDGSAGLSGDGAGAAGARLNGPSGVSIDSAANFYIADTNNNRIRKVATSGVISTFIGDGAIGFWNLEGGPASPTVLNHPTDVAVAPDGLTLYFADFNQWSPVATTNVTVRDALNTGPSRVQRVNIATHTIRALPIPLNGALMIALDSAGKLYISERFGHRILKYDPDSGAVTTIAGTGTAGFSGDGGPATSAQIHDPSQVTVDAAGNIYFSDSQNNRIRKISAGTGIITTVAGNGNRGAGGDRGPATSAELNSPEGIAVDLAGNMLIADTGNQRIRRVDVRTGVITTMVARPESNECSASLVAFMTPLSIEVNPSGDYVYIADNTGNRVWKASVIPEKGPPTFTSMTPSSSTPGNTVSVTISGTGFAPTSCPGSGATVSIAGSGVTLGGMSIVSDTSLTATFVVAGDAAPGARDVTVRNASGLSSPQPFTVTVPSIPAPTLTSITPSIAAKGSTVTVTFIGTNFDTRPGNTTASIEGGGISVTQVTVSSPTSMTAAVTVGAEAALNDHAVRVATAGGTSNAVSLTVVPAGPAFVYHMPPILNPTEHTPVQVALANPSSDTVTGTLTLTFTPNATNPGEDHSVMFVNTQTSTRTTTVTFPANSSTVEFSLPNGLLQAGTEAGTIQLSMNGVRVGGLAVAPASGSFDVQVPLGVPVITNVRILNRSAAGFDVEITGYSTPRDISSATFDFGAASGKSLLTLELKPNVVSTFTAYYQSPTSDGVGGSFVYTQPFKVEQGDVNAVASVTVTLANSQGSSQPKTAR